MRHDRQNKVEQYIYNKVYSLLSLLLSLLLTIGCSEMHSPELHPSGKLRIELQVNQGYR